MSGIEWVEASEPSVGMTNNHDKSNLSIMTDLAAENQLFNILNPVILTARSNNTHSSNNTSNREDNTSTRLNNMNTDDNNSDTNGCYPPSEKYKDSHKNSIYLSKDSHKNSIYLSTPSSRRGLSMRTLSGRARPRSVRLTRHNTGSSSQFGGNPLMMTADNEGSSVRTIATTDSNDNSMKSSLKNLTSCLSISLEDILPATKTTKTTTHDTALPIKTVKFDGLDESSPSVVATEDIITEKVGASEGVGLGETERSRVKIEVDVEENKQDNAAVEPSSSSLPELSPLTTRNSLETRPTFSVVNSATNSPVYNTTISTSSSSSSAAAVGVGSSTTDTNRNSLTTRIRGNSLQNSFSYGNRRKLSRSESENYTALHSGSGLLGSVPAVNNATRPRTFSNLSTPSENNTHNHSHIHLNSNVNMNMNDYFERQIVLDVGTYQTRAGFADEQTPKSVFRTLVACSEDSIQVIGHINNKTSL